jgi:hypothetical protein
VSEFFGGGAGGIASISAGTTNATGPGVSFADSNGLSFGVNGNTITGSYTVPTVTNSSWTVSDNATSGTVGRLAFTNLNGVTLSLSSGTGGLHTIVGSHNALTSQSNQAFSAAGGSSTFQTLSFGDTNSVSWTNTNGSVGIASIKLQMFAVSNTTQNTSGTANHTALSFGGAGIASVGVTGGSVVVSVPAGGGAGDGGVFAGVSSLGNTAGSTGTVSTGNFVLVGSSGITLSQSTGAAGSAATVTILGPGNNATFSTFWSPDNMLTTVGAPINATYSVVYCPFHEYVTATRVDIAASINVATTTNTSSAAYLYSGTLVILTRTASTLSSLSSTTMANTITWASNSTGSVTGGKFLSFALNMNASPGNYFMAVQLSTRATGHAGAATTSLGNTFTMFGVGSAVLGAVSFAEPGSSTNSTNNWFIQGLNSSTGNITRISLSNVTMVGTFVNRAAIGFRFQA